MKKPLQHIEDFVRSKLSLLEGDAQTDWLDFDRKLRRAAHIRRMKRAAGVLGLILLLGFSQTFISGDWPLHKATQKQDLASKESNKPDTNLDAAAQLIPASTINSSTTSSAATSESALSVVHSNSRNSVPPKSIEPATALTNSQSHSATASSSSLAVAQSEIEPSLERTTRSSRTMSDPIFIEASRTNPSEETAFDRNVQEPVKWEPKRDFAPKPLPKGKLIKDGEAPKESALPFDYEAPSLSLNPKLLDARKIDFLKSTAQYTPYISPLQEVRPWTYSLNIYPNFAFREFKIDRQRRSLLHSDFIDAMQASEASGVNLSIGFEISKRIGPITYLNSGIEYINNSYNAEFDFLNFRQANFNSEGEIVNYTMLRNPQRITFTDLNSFHFLNFPLSISYQPWATDHLRINLEFGFSMLYFLEAQGSTIDYRSLETIDLAERSYRKYMASSSLKIGVQYYLSQNMNIGLEPTLMYFTNSIYTEEYPFEVIPYSLGLNLNLQMKLQ